MKEEESKSED